VLPPEVVSDADVAPPALVAVDEGAVLSPPVGAVPAVEEIPLAGVVLSLDAADPSLEPVELSPVAEVPSVDSVVLAAGVSVLAPVAVAASLWLVDASLVVPLAVVVPVSVLVLATCPPRASAAAA
jgi:hypothetical protein